MGPVYVVVKGTPFQVTTDPKTKYAPLTVSTMALLPTSDEAGFKLVIVGNGLLIVNASALEVPPPGGPVKTVTLALPRLAISVARIVARSSVLFTNVVRRSWPFQRIFESIVKFAPATVSWNAALPAVAVDGVILVREGRGAAAMIEKSK